LAQYPELLFFESKFTVIFLRKTSFHFAKPIHIETPETYQPVSIVDTLPGTDTSLKVFEIVEVEASFAGGETAWRSYLQQNLNPLVPIRNKDPVGIYTVYIQFIVSKEGKVSDIKALTNHGYGMEKEVMRILRKAPKWMPALQEGKPVNAYRKQPVTFQVSKE
jgi:protein TonB